jgi:uncharacterized protein YbbK (DUF523 family)
VIRVLVSACLLGEAVRYHGGDATCQHPVLARWRREGRIVPFCPEIAGGLGVPRPAAEILGDGGAAVLSGTGRVLDVKGRVVTAEFVEGGRLALERARENHIRVAILKDGSPSCGSGFIFDGSFRGSTRPGVGVTTALLAQNGLRVFSETEIEAADAWIRGLNDVG